LIIKRLAKSERLVNSRVPADSSALIVRLIETADKGQAELLVSRKNPSRMAGFHWARKATQSHPKATPKPHQSHPKAR
jgi:hypothetical protein